MDLRTVISNSISTIRPQDIIDILIVAFLLFKLLQLVRESNTGRLLQGLMIIIIAAPITKWLGLNMLNFLIAEALKLGIIALVILFQPELRKMLDSVGGSGKLPNLLKSGQHLRKEEMDRVIATAVEAATYLSLSRIGALIVFERNAKLDEISKSGTKVDAEFNTQLIKNIFMPKAPLHDGAMIVCEGRIDTVACVLPLSENTMLSADIGTRHRAAVGVSEKTDAVALVVSEETGSVSVAVGGMLKRHLNAEVLEKILQNELAADIAVEKVKTSSGRRKKKDEN